MRPFLKYKIYSKLTLFKDVFPKTRILKFKSTKWKKVQKLLRIKKKRRYTYLKSNLNTFLTRKRVTNLKRYYKESLLLKKSIHTFYGRTLSLKFFRKLLNNKIKSYKKYIFLCFLRPLFQLDILLWKSGFFQTTFATHQGILAGQILVNKQVVGFNYKVKVGDVIYLESFPNLQVVKSLVKMCSFIEIDYYLKRIIILKTFNELDISELLLLFRDLVDLKKITAYLNYK